jgi:hypothetical protein
MSIYIVQGRGVLGCGRKAPPRRPLSLSARALLARPAGPTSGFHFSLRSENETTKTGENNKTLQCEVNGAVRSVGRRGWGCKRRRRGARRGQRPGSWAVCGAPRPPAATAPGAGRAGGSAPPRAHGAGSVPGPERGSPCWPLAACPQAWARERPALWTRVLAQHSENTSLTTFQGGWAGIMGLPVLSLPSRRGLAVSPPHLGEQIRKIPISPPSDPCQDC